MYYRRSNGCICQPSRGANIPKLGLCWVPRKGACTSQDRREELLTIRHFPPTLAVGDLVRITGKGNVALRAVLLAFMLPTLLILAGALVLSKAGWAMPHGTFVATDISDVCTCAGATSPLFLMLNCTACRTNYSTALELIYNNLLYLCYLHQ